MPSVQTSPKIAAIPIEVENFLWHLALQEADITPLSADASSRRYFRVSISQALQEALSLPPSVLVMFDPPPASSLERFGRVDEILRSAGLSAPRIFVQDPARYCALIEDFGDNTLTRALRQGADEAAIYKACVTTLIALQKKQPASLYPQGHPDCKPYDWPAAWRELQQFSDWFFPERVGRVMPPEGLESFERLWHEAWQWAHAALPPTLVCRDFHVDNLMLLPDRQPPHDCGLIDFQDALWGSPTYDLVSLLQDARRDVSEAVEIAMKDMFFAQFSATAGWTWEAFERAYQTMGLQRNTKILGFCVRMYRQQGRTQYLPFLPRVWRVIQTNLSHPALSSLAAWYDAWVPEAARQPHPEAVCSTGVEEKRMMHP